MRRYVDVTINRYPEHRHDNFFIFKDLAKVILLLYMKYSIYRPSLKII